jgi:deoxyhypusine synthase
MKRVEPIVLRKGMSVDDLVRQYEKTGALGAGGLGKAAEIFEAMVREEVTLFLGISGPLVPAGLRRVFVDLIRDHWVDVIVSSGANLVHDFVEGMGGSHWAGSFREDDVALQREGHGRIGNVLMRKGEMDLFEGRLKGILEALPEDLRKDLSIREFLTEVGKHVEDENSLLRAAQEEEVPIFSPALLDSMFGLSLFQFAQEEAFVLNALKDLEELAGTVEGAEKTGALLLGGGVPKHYVLGANTLRGGIDYGIQITLDREEGGSLSGAKLEEGISWEKAKVGSRLVSLTGDVTVLFPLLVASVKERVP